MHFAQLYDRNLVRGGRYPGMALRSWYENLQHLLNVDACVQHYHKWYEQMDYSTQFDDMEDFTKYHLNVGMNEWSDDPIFERRSTRALDDGSKSGVHCND